MSEQKSQKIIFKGAYIEFKDIDQEEDYKDMYVSICNNNPDMKGFDAYNIEHIVYVLENSEDSPVVVSRDYTSVTMESDNFTHVITVVKSMEQYEVLTTLNKNIDGEDMLDKMEYNHMLKRIELDIQSNLEIFQED